MAMTACSSPTPPSISAQDAADIDAEYDVIIALPNTVLADLPPGSASFVGHAGAEISGDADGSVVGDMVMNVNFAGNTIDGTIDNLNVVDFDGIPEQLLGGSLTISGAETDGALTATASGNLTAVGEESVRGTSYVTLNMVSDVRIDTSNGDTVVGTVSGSGNGDFDLTIYDGGFFGSSN